MHTPPLRQYPSYDGGHPVLLFRTQWQPSFPRREGEVESGTVKDITFILCFCEQHALWSLDESGSLRSVDSHLPNQTCTSQELNPSLFWIVILEAKKEWTTLNLKWTTGVLVRLTSHPATHRYCTPNLGSHKHLFHKVHSSKTNLTFRGPPQAWDYSNWWEENVTVYKARQAAKPLGFEWFPTP